MSKLNLYARSWGTAVAVICGCVALAARPSATLAAFAVTLAVGMIGALVPVPTGEQGRSGGPRWLGTVGLGVAAFAIGRWLRPLMVPMPLTPLLVMGNVVAAVAEELFFRRLMYGWLSRLGPGVAIGGTAVAFAVVHVPAYGVRALPIDIAAGILFGWQRWETEGWFAPAVTHVAANLFQMR
jgi:membrane protease YdiL (CAAX protease family)